MRKSWMVSRLLESQAKRPLGPGRLSASGTQELENRFRANTCMALIPLVAGGRLITLPRPRQVLGPYSRAYAPTRRLKVIIKSRLVPLCTEAVDEKHSSSWVPVVSDGRVSAITPHGGLPYQGPYGRPYPALQRHRCGAQRQSNPSVCHEYHSAVDVACVTNTRERLM